MKTTTLITGSTSGIGKATAQALAQEGWQLILHGRKEETCRAVAEELKATTQNEQIDFIHADLSELAQVQRMADEIKERFPMLNVLINNAGTFSKQRILTREGLERTWVVNYLSRFLLVNELRELLEQNRPSRIIDVSGAYHKKGQIHFEDISLKKDYSLYEANNQSKLANVLHTQYLAEQILPKGITLNTLHPGAVNSGSILKSADFSAFAKWTYRLMAPMIKTPAKGAATSVFLAKAKELEGITGKYFVNQKIAASSKASQDIHLQEQLWQLSQQMIDRVLPK